jgi:hypothetical protein
MRNSGDELSLPPAMIRSDMWRQGGYFHSGSSSGDGSSSRHGSSFDRGSPSEEERKKLVRSVSAKEHAARKWTNHGLRLPLSLLPYADA